jgi:hypothetical protein
MADAQTKREDLIALKKHCPQLKEMHLEIHNYRFFGDYQPPILEEFSSLWPGLKPKN